MTFKIKLAHNFGPLSITFSLRHLFSTKMAIFCVFGRTGYQEPKQFQSKRPRWNTFLPQSKQNSKFSFFFSIVQVPMGVYGIFRSPVQGGSNELISKFLSFMILYNHSSYFKSGEVNSCRLSPLPTLPTADFAPELVPGIEWWRGQIRDTTDVTFFAGFEWGAAYKSGREWIQFWSSRRIWLWPSGGDA